MPAIWAAAGTTSSAPHIIRQRQLPRIDHSSVSKVQKRDATDRDQMRSTSRCAVQRNGGGASEGRVALMDRTAARGGPLRLMTLAVKPGAKRAAANRGESASPVAMSESQSGCFAGT